MPPSPVSLPSGAGHAVSPTPSPPLVVILTTHTTRHLRRTLLGVASQARRPEGVVVSCDNDSAEIRQLVEEAAAEFGLDTTLVQRPFAGTARSGQVRNNAVRALEADGLHDSARLVFLDGDCVPMPGALAAHERLGGWVMEGPGRLVVGFRIDLTEGQTDLFDEGALRAGRVPVAVTSDQVRLLRKRDRRYRRQAFFRRLGLAKRHKPKVLSANFSVCLGDFRAVNGFDEAYEGYGQEDDDLGRRCYRLGCPPVVGVDAARVLHLYHPTRAPGTWAESPNAGRFRESGPVRCKVGLDDPAPQAPVMVHRFAAGSQPARATC